MREPGIEGPEGEREIGISPRPNSELSNSRVCLRAFNELDLNVETRAVSRGRRMALIFMSNDED